MSGARVLVVDDEPEVRRALQISLARRGYAVQLAATGQDALGQFSRARPDIVLLDLQLPDISGLEVCRVMRDESDVPIIILSVRGEETVKVRALDLGADDYITKPFGVDEVFARMRATLRRASGAGHGPNAVIQHGHLRIDVERREVTVDGQPVHLRPKEYDMLRYLAANAGKLITHRMLLREVWGSDYEDARPYLHVHVGQLRRKIERDRSRPAFIITEPGVGYRFVPDEGILEDI